MLKYRIIFGVYFIASCILYILANGKAAFAILVTAVLVPVSSVVLAAIAARKVSAFIERSPAIDSEEALVMLKLSNKGILPVSRAEVLLSYTNVRTGETAEIPVSAPLPPRRDVKVPVELPGVHAGLCRISLSGFIIYDHLRLAVLKRKADGITEFLSRPKRFHINVDTSGAAAATLDGEKYSDRRSGNDPGEVRAIHEYVPGDPVRNIHWKLSEKTDKLLVKELGLPATDQVLVLMDTFYNEEDPAECADILASVFSSMLESLVDEDIDYSAGWLDPETGRIRTVKMTDAAVLESAAWHYLAVPPSDTGIFEYISSNGLDSRFAHLVVTGREFSPAAQIIAGSCRVTMLLYGQTGTGLPEGGLSVIGFDSADYREKLAAIEI